MAQYIDKDALLEGIENYISNYKEIVAKTDRKDSTWVDSVSMIEAKIDVLKHLLSFLVTLEVKEVDCNNGWIDCSRQMPKESKQWSDTLQGHREWTESDLVLAWDSMYGCRVDATRNGKWMSECKGGYTGQIVHGIIAWRPIPEFSEELLIKAQKGEEI